jgi:hypothetical protein
MTAGAPLSFSAASNAIVFLGCRKLRSAELILVRRCGCTRAGAADGDDGVTKASAALVVRSKGSSSDRGRRRLGRERERR